MARKLPDSKRGPPTPKLAQLHTASLVPRLLAAARGRALASGTSQPEDRAPINDSRPRRPFRAAGCSRPRRGHPARPGGTRSRSGRGRCWARRARRRGSTVFAARPGSLSRAARGCDVVPARARRCGRRGRAAAPGAPGAGAPAAPGAEAAAAGCAAAAAAQAPGVLEDETKPEDCIPDVPGNEHAREFLAHAPTKGLWMPLGKEVKVMQCWRCKRYGHRTGDKECPFFIKGNQKLEQFRVAHEDPMYDIIRENKRHEKDIRIQQLKQLLEDSTSDDDGSSSSSSEDKEKHKKKKKKEKHKKKKKDKKKKKKRKHKSSKSNESSDSE
ncbi:retinitis pigmentosa 9 protein homolog isoform X2 [Bubalus bubalis]|uniref:retinitis pigmentosa 9 protein homolog isoform X2 n=1 Tax=Bubalus bubalis TaxID=89462 RepID=UPI000DBC9F39|nr:retinitis pigmentosa 9 protein homolog isoform X2 [Bubalus bubalis]